MSAYEIGKTYIFCTSEGHALGTVKKIYSDELLLQDYAKVEFHRFCGKDIEEGRIKNVIYFGDAIIDKICIFVAFPWLNETYKFNAEYADNPFAKNNGRGK